MAITVLDYLKANPASVVVILIFNDSVVFNCWFELPFLLSLNCELMFDN
jgi:hypothetical protein